VNTLMDYDEINGSITAGCPLTKLEKFVGCMGISPSNNQEIMGKFWLTGFPIVASGNSGETLCKLDWIGLRENLQETRVIFPLNMGLSCRFSLKPIY